jgi:hypothetical protein
MTEQEQQAIAALQQNIAEIRERAAALKARHAAATTSMMRYAPAPGSTPTRRAQRRPGANTCPPEAVRERMAAQHCGKIHGGFEMSRMGRPGKRAKIEAKNGGYGTVPKGT